MFLFRRFFVWIFKVWLSVKSASRRDCEITWSKRLHVFCQNGAQEFHLWAKPFIPASTDRPWIQGGRSRPQNLVLKIKSGGLFWPPFWQLSRIKELHPGPVNSQRTWVTWFEIPQKEATLRDLGESCETLPEFSYITDDYNRIFDVYFFSLFFMVVWEQREKYSWNPF